MSAEIEKIEVIDQIHKIIAQDLERPDVVHTSAYVGGGFASALVTIKTKAGNRTFDGYDYTSNKMTAFGNAYIRALQFIYYGATSE